MAIYAPHIDSERFFISTLTWYMCKPNCRHTINKTWNLYKCTCSFKDDKKKKTYDTAKLMCNPKKHLQHLLKLLLEIDRRVPRVAGT